MNGNEETTSQSKSSAPAISQVSGGSTAQPSSEPALLTPEQADAQLGTHTVKIYIKLQDDGCNIRPWMKMVRDTAAIRRCQMALQQEYPDTAVDAVATQILMSSVSENFQNIIASMPSAYSAYNYIRKLFVEGHNQNANTVWFSQLEIGMQPTDSLEQYCMRMQRLYQCLRGNNATIEEFHVMKHLVKGLPAEMDPVKISLHGNLAGKPLSEALTVSRAAAYGIDIDDSAPREPPESHQLDRQQSSASWTRPTKAYGALLWWGSSNSWTRIYPWTWTDCTWEVTNQREDSGTLLQEVQTTWSPLPGLPTSQGGS